MVTEKELAAPNRRRTLDWVQGLGCPRVVLTSFTVSPSRTRNDWVDALARVGELAQHVRTAGLDFVLHTQPDLWAAGTGGLQELRRWLDRDRCLVEFDPTGAMIHGADPAAFVRLFADALYAVHLRDGMTPPEPVFYLPAEPLGDGGVRWKDLLGACASSTARWYVLEMETADRAQVLPAIRRSLEYLHEQGLVESA
jgi:sugar phosphate isomerase/epimerase